MTTRSWWNTASPLPVLVATSSLVEEKKRSMFPLPDNGNVFPGREKERFMFPQPDSGNVFPGQGKETFHVSPT